MGFVDIHNHILPGVDDGAEDYEEALGMIQLAYEQGTRVIVCTPHYTKGANSYTYDGLEEVCDELTKKVKTLYEDVDIYLGNEILYEEGIVDDLKAGLIHTMGQSKYVLVEFNIRIPYQEMYHAFQKLSKARFRPILAHVERYACLMKQEACLQELLDMGVCLQMNASSVEGSMWDEQTRWCRRLIKRGYIQLIGTDAHDMNHRVPFMKEAYEWVIKKCGAEMADALFVTNSKKVLENQYIL